MNSNFKFSPGTISQNQNLQPTKIRKPLIPFREGSALWLREKVAFLHNFGQLHNPKEKTTGEIIYVFVFLGINWGELFCHTGSQFVGSGKERMQSFDWRALCIH